MYAILLIVWRKNSGATLQLINFSFSLGAFFAPLIARPFLCEETVHMNISCADVFERYDNQIDNLTNNSCLEIAERNCSAESGGPSWLLIDCRSHGRNYVARRIRHKKTRPDNSTHTRITVEPLIKDTPY